MDTSRHYADRGPVQAFALPDAVTGEDPLWRVGIERALSTNGSALRFRCVPGTGISNYWYYRISGGLKVDYWKIHLLLRHLSQGTLADSSQPDTSRSVEPLRNSVRPIEVRGPQ